MGLQYIGHCLTNVNVMARLKFFPITAIQTVRSHNSTLVQSRKLILSVYVYLIIIYKFNKYYTNSERVDSVNSISQLWIMLGSQDSVVLYICRHQ